jgi:uncharacterized protein YaiL (DUF2058 family)
VGDLRDELKKSKLLSDKDARRIAHEQRLHKTEVGREGIEQEQRARSADLDRMREEDRGKARSAQEEADRQRALESERAACAEILERETVKPRPGGGGRWYFQVEDGSVPSIEVGEAEKRKLGAGAYVIVRLVEDGPAATQSAHVYALLPTPHARRIRTVFPERIAWAPRGMFRG